MKSTAFRLEQRLFECLVDRRPVSARSQVMLHMSMPVVATTGWSCNAEARLVWDLEVGYQHMTETFDNMSISTYELVDGIVRIDHYEILSL